MSLVKIQVTLCTVHEVSDYNFTSVSILVAKKKDGLDINRMRKLGGGGCEAAG